MARVSPIISDSESPNGTSSGKGKASSKLIKSTTPMDVDEEEGEGEGEEGGEEEESEYEIEAILDAKRGSFPEGRMGYFVKWKGYGPEENSWVDEKDAGNADDLIAEYWQKNPKPKKAPRKSVDSKTPKRSRKSVPDVASEEESVSVVKKRGRKPKADSDVENGQGDESGDARAAKKSRKTNNKSQTKGGAQHPVSEVIEIGDMKHYMSVPSWESLVESVDTIEKQDDGKLMVYFALKSGERVRETSTVCAERFPQLLIKFYEANLRWRVAEGSEVDDS